MGVHNLWELLSPVGRRVSVETLAGKRVAIDASIWIIQFMKAMRDERGEMVRNAHLIGFFRRICKLLFLRTKPVFVFDGGTPALKRRTVIARRRQRENAQMKIRKTAEKLLMNQLKSMKLKQLADDLKNQRRESDDVKGKKVLSDQTEAEKSALDRNDTTPVSYNQEKMDEMLAASLAAEENGIFTGNASTSTAGIGMEEDDDDEDEEMILPVMPGKVDPAVLASLPPSMQLDLLVQMRERLMAENRQKYQKVKKAPAKFSELQIESYLKTVAFRREIGEVQRAAAGRGVGGVQTSRIASESNREFIFSSSFTGDKQALTSAVGENRGNVQHPIRYDLLDKTTPTIQNSTVTTTVGDEPGGGLENDVETYVDDRGNLRVSRVRAMGIRMTRDLQRNLEMMKEMEDGDNSNEIPSSDVLVRDVSSGSLSFLNKDQFPKTSNATNDDRDTIVNTISQQFDPNFIAPIEISFENNDEQKCSESDDDIFASLVAGKPVIEPPSLNISPGKQTLGSDSESDWEDGDVEDKDSLTTPRTSNAANDDMDMIVNNINQQSVVSIEIPFEDNGEQKCTEGDDDIFASLVAGKSIMVPPVLNTSPGKQTFGSDSESDWEDGNVENKVSLANGVQAVIKPPFVKGNTSDESKIEPDKGIRDMTESVDPPVEYSVAISKGCQEEETDMQEAIRRSIDDLNQKHHVDGSSQNGIRKYHAEMAHENPRAKLRFGGSHTGVDVQDGVIETSPQTIFVNSGSQLASSTRSNSKETHFVDLEEVTRETNWNSEKIVDAFNEVGETSTKDYNFQVNDSFPGLPLNNDHDASKGGSEFADKTKDSVALCGDFSAKRTPLTVDAEQNMADIRDKRSFIVDTEKSRAEFTESTLEDEILVLDQEFVNLEDEQRRNERNAESVSSEMFSECQELLQMFGLPYIIAPMEAEAQCAYMELANLVDGVVTDDSDVFLFGARSVYKNIFDDRKYVETYFMKDIESELGLSRDKLIRMALLLGSDYTEGISGIGIVNAIEVVNAFPEEDGFHKFREWIESPDPNIFGKLEGKTGSTSKKRGPSVDENNANHSDENLEGASVSEPNQLHADDHQSTDVMYEQRQIFMDKHRNVSKNWHIPSSFPSEAVISAYSSPQVDKSTEPFTWGKPDLNLLRKLCWGKFGWNIQKADELLLPVLKEYNKHETQLRLEAFYTFNEKFAKVRSKRIKKAVKGIIGNQSSEGPEASQQPNSKARKKRRVDHVESAGNETELLLHTTDDDVGRNESSYTSSHKQSGEQVITPSGEGKIQASKRASGKGRVRDGSSGKSSTRGRGRNQQVGRGRKRGQVSNSVKSSSSDGKSSNDEQETNNAKFQEPHELRRSSRSRNPVDYSGNDLELDDVENMGGEECANKDAMNQEQSSLYDLSKDKPVAIFADPSLETGISENRCEMGNEGCMYEDKIGELNASQVEDEANYSNDYLKMGGGFCMDEDVNDKSPENQSNDSASAATVEFIAGYHLTDSVDKTEHEDLTELGLRDERTLNNVQFGRSTDTSSASQHLNLVYDTANDLNAAVVSEENTKDPNNKTSIGALSAMPLLRRKKRKT